VRTRSAALLAVSLLLLGVACSSDDGGSGADRGGAPATTTTSARTSASAGALPDGPQACDLLTTAELQAALGHPFAAGAPVEAPSYGTACTWTATEGEPPISVSVVVATDAQLQVALGRVARALYDQTREAAQVDENLALGDASYRAGPQVVVLTDGTLLSVAVTDASSASIAGVEALAAAAVEALPR
jgi:hypothetical protein